MSYFLGKEFKNFMIKSLRLYSSENDINCSTCRRSFKNYYSEIAYKMICMKYDRIIKDHEVCIDWECWLEN